MKKRIKDDLEMYIKRATYKSVLPFFAMFVMLGISCSSQKTSSTEPKQSSSKVTPLTLILRDSYGGSATPQIQVIKEPGTLKKFFSEVNRTRKPGLAMPKINFDKEMVIIICTGEQQNNQIPALYAVEEMANKMILEVKEETKLEGTSSEAYTAPFCIYKMPLTSKELVFKKN